MQIAEVSIGFMKSRSSCNFQIRRESPSKATDSLGERSAMFIQAQSRLESIGVGVTRYGLVTVLLLIGLAKFTREEAAGIQPLVAHSPFMFWMYHLFTTEGVSRIIGSIEIITALLIASRPFSPRSSLVGSLAAVVTFVVTTTFLLSTPGALQLTAGISILGPAGQFLIKDLVLLGGSIYIAAEATRAVKSG
jgi:reactive chlorine resistance protein C